MNNNELLFNNLSQRSVNQIKEYVRLKHGIEDFSITKHEHFLYDATYLDLLRISSTGKKTTVESFDFICNLKLIRDIREAILLLIDNGYAVYKGQGNQQFPDY